jgi:hypothetical protein
MGIGDEPTVYRIVVRGRLGPHFAEVFDDLTPTRTDGVTELVGPVRDQAELQGVIDLLVGLGNEIVSVGRAPGPRRRREPVDGVRHLRDGGGS